MASVRESLMPMYTPVQLKMSLTPWSFKPCFCILLRFQGIMLRPPAHVAMQIHGESCRGYQRVGRRSRQADFFTEPAHSLLYISLPARTRKLVG